MPLVGHACVHVEVKLPFGHDVRVVIAWCIILIETSDHVDSLAALIL